MRNNKPFIPMVLQNNSRRDTSFDRWSETLMFGRTINIASPVRPTHVVIDLTWANYFEKGTHWFFVKFPVKSIIEIFTSIPTDMDCSDLLWHEVEARLSDEELMSSDIEIVDIIFENLITYFYEQLNMLIPLTSDQYVFDHWLDSNSMVMVREDVWYGKRDNLVKIRYTGK